MKTSAANRTNEVSTIMGTTGSQVAGPLDEEKIACDKNAAPTTRLNAAAEVGT